MARKLKDITEEILNEKGKYRELDPLDSTSKTSIWRLFVYVIAYTIFNLELLFDRHREEVDNLIAELKPHTAKWYRNKALAFQYGFDLYPDTDVFNNEGYTDDQIEASKVVKYSAITEDSNRSRLIVKVAGEKNGELVPLTTGEVNSFTAYMEEIKDAGVPLTIINYLPDLLYLNITIKIDPLVLDENGNAIAPINENIRPVDTTIRQYLRELPFNGELMLSKLVDKLQLTPGVKDVNIYEASSSWIDPQTKNYGNPIAITMSKIPNSGYFTTIKNNGNNKIENLVKIDYNVV
ncbi:MULTISPECIES: nucleotidyltransferase [unclassified Apibacter]|uniref:nucleotidyltransferase n=1 Tax=unclassified Apibacter TaxID=2630820 RepID=UPI002104D2E9|nr:MULTISPECIES: nucleotidyltransferase [unclassified Apibacter]